MQEEAAHLAYRVRWRAEEARPGKHLTRHAGLGGDFRAFRPFWQLPDARRIDVRRTALDPFGDVIVRQNDGRSGIALIVAADLSRSVGARAGGLGDLTRLVQAASRSALRAGDAFGFLGFDAAVREVPRLMPTRSRGAAGALAARLSNWVPDGRSAAGIEALPAHLPERRSLVLLVSDFLMPLGSIVRALTGLHRHDVAPVVWQDSLPEGLPRHGLLRVRDAEGGATRLVLLRPALQARWTREAAERRAALDAVFARFGRPAFHVHGSLDVAALGEHLMAA